MLLLMFRSIRCSLSIAQSAASCLFETPSFALGNEGLPTKSFAVTSDGGSLLQHWLRFQDANDAAAVAAAASTTRKSDNRPGTGIRKHQPESAIHQKQHQQMAYGRHQHRRLSGGTAAQWVKPSSQYDLDHPQEVGKPHLMESSNSNGTQQQQGGLVVGYYLCDDPVPYRTVWFGSVASAGNQDQHIASSCANAGSLTLGQFKQLVAKKKGVYR